MSIQQVIEEHYGNAWDVGDVLICLSDAVATNDPERARHAMMRCGDVARRLERRQRKDPANEPAPESEVERETVSDDMGSTWVKCGHPKCDLHVVRPGKSQCSCEDGMGGGLDSVCQDWHGAVREMRTGTPNSAMSAVIAPTPSTPGWMDKAAETLVEKRIDSDEEIYQWGGGRWQISNDKTFCWNARECAWNESTMTPEQLRQDGTRVLP